MGFPLPDTGTVVEDSGAILTTTGDVNYLFGNDSGEWTAETITGSYGSQLSIDADGVWVYTADNSNAAIDALNTGDTLTDVFTVTSNNGTTTVTVTIQGNTDVICFTPGTMITTPVGPLPVEDLRKGDLVVTRDHGLQAIRWIGETYIPGARLQAMQHLRPIRVARHAFGPDIPNRDTWFSRQHRILLDDLKTRLLFGQDEVLAPAGFLTDDPNIGMDTETTEVRYFHILFDRHEVIFSNGLQSESFHPGETSLNGFDDAVRQEVFELFPHLRSTPNGYGKSARYSLKPAEAKSLSRAADDPKTGLEIAS
jgi:VCBS repeat-containing protein